MKGDRGKWIVGLSPKKSGNKVVFAMEITNVLTFEEYDISHIKKRPKFGTGRRQDMIGDNIYTPENGDWEQRRSVHSKNPKDENWSEDEKQMKRDLSGEYVLLSKNFFYFGKSAKELPKELKQLIGGRGHRCNFENEEKLFESFISFILKYKPGIHGNPTEWKKEDTCGGCDQ